MDKRTLPHPQNDARRNQTRELKQSGLTYRQIGKIMGISHQRVQQLVSCSPKKKKEVLKRSNGLCEKCKRDSDILHIHHISYVPEAIEVLCISCHMHSPSHFDYIYIKTEKELA